MQVLVEIGRTYYEYVEYYLKEIAEVTFHFARKVGEVDEKVGA